MHLRFLLAFSALTLPAHRSLPAQTARVPFIGCKSDGQVGPLKAPAGKPRLLRIPASAANQLAYYKAENAPGVLGPRGWFCFSTYGSNGGSLYLSPKPIPTGQIFKHWEGLSGPAIQVSASNGGTSGRFEVAAYIARYFPSHMDFTRQVIAEGIEPAKDFPRGPYPHDKLTYRSHEIVEYETPANTDGLGTHTWLVKDDQPIAGVLVLQARDDFPLTRLAVRLPPNLASLSPIILQQVERENR
jgi:hypothetical protein